MPMPLIPNIALFQRKLAGFPIATYQAGETVLRAASTTGRLLILKKGVVTVLKEGVEIGTVREPGAVFGEISVLLDQPHTADVCALEASRRCQPGAHRAEAPSSGWPAAWCDRENGRRNRRTAGRQQRPSWVCPLSLRPVRLRQIK